jgi:hypothetical protein
LSFLAGVLRASADTSIMDPYLSVIFDATNAISAEEGVVFNIINGSALARKMMIKVIRSVVTLLLRNTQQSLTDMEMAETTIGYFLERLADNDTPVRLAASKALSIITLKLESDMASQVIEAVLEGLNRNVLWVKNIIDPAVASTQDVTAVDPLEWHGLMLTLSHLLYRRAPPPENLSDIIHALLMGLSFEKRSPSGGSIGSNVRDASCFGIWALARRYNTKELLAVETRSVLVARGHDSAASILQVVATELVVTASLDPAGNIRRGASAALQELIGRHPDTVEEGIAVVQTVDYHAVALRSRAIRQVALHATRLSGHYGRALLKATLGWRGVGDMDAAARRVAASSFGNLASEITAIESSDQAASYARTIGMLLPLLESLAIRQVEERHGTILSLAAVLDSLPGLVKSTGTMEGLPIRALVATTSQIIEDSKTTKFRKPELIAEAVGRLAVSALPLVVMAASPMKETGREGGNILRPGPLVVHGVGDNNAPAIMELVDALQGDRPDQLGEFVAGLEDAVDGWLDRNESEVTSSSSEAVFALLLLSTKAKRDDIIRKLGQRIESSHTPRNRHGNGYFHALVRAYPVAEAQGLRDSLVRSLLARWARDDDIETRQAILQSLAGSAVLRDRALDFLGIISEGLDDYTTTARGDIGSHVRIEAIKTTKTIWAAFKHDQATVSALYPRILRLASEKLDRVRGEARAALSMAMQDR